MNATFGNAIVGALARLLRPFGLGPLAGADPELPESGPVITHHHRLPDGSAGLPDGSEVWHRHSLPDFHPWSFEAAHPGQDPDRQ